MSILASQVAQTLSHWLRRLRATLYSSRAIGYVADTTCASTSSVNRATRSREIRAFAQLVRTLPQTARRLWNSARSRDFDIGIGVPRRGDSATLELPQDVVKLASSVRGQIHFTVYASNGRGSPPNKRLKLAARVH